MRRKKYQANRILTFNNPLAPRVCPELAKEIGLNESMVLLQMEFWLATEGEEHEGYIWCRKTVREIRELFSFFSLGTSQRVLQELLNKQLIVFGQFDSGSGRSAKWYRLNLDEIKKLKSVRVLDSNVPDLNNECSTFEGESDQNGTSVLISIKDQDQKTRATALETPRVKDPRTDPLVEVVEGMLEYLSTKIGPLPSPKRQTNAARWLLTNDYDAEEAEKCLDYLLSETWRTTVVDWCLVQKEIGNWKRRSSPAKWTPPQSAKAKQDEYHGPARTKVDPVAKARAEACTECNGTGTKHKMIYPPGNPQGVRAALTCKHENVT